MFTAWAIRLINPPPLKNVNYILKKEWMGDGYTG